jgi:hypothetical protein
LCTIGINAAYFLIDTSNSKAVATTFVKIIKTYIFDFENANLLFKQWKSTSETAWETSTPIVAQVVETIIESNTV